MTTLAPDKPRIMGSEMEYGFVPYDADKKVIPDWPDSVKYKEALPKDFVHINNFLPNGGKLYIDMGNHPEYASPECTDLDDLVAHEIAGELIAFDVFSQIAAKDNNPLETFRLYKSVASADGTYWGYHENYQFGRIAPNTYRDRIVPLLAIHLATRGTLFGAGHMGATYQVTQKGLGVGSLRDTTASTRGKRPLIDTVREEAHADSSKWQRIHIPSMDPNMLPWPTWMKFGTTSIVLRMIEAGINLDDLLLANPVKAIHTVSKDTDLKSGIQLKNGNMQTALGIQTELAKRARKFAQQQRLSDQEQEVIEEWNAACADLQQDPELCYGRVEWVTKRRQLAHYAMRHDIPYGDPRMNAASNMWVNLDPDGKGGALSLRARGTLQKTPSTAAIEKAIDTAPKTRASLRGRMVVALFAAKQKSDASGTVNWASMNVLNRDIKLPNPRQTANREVRRAIRKLKLLERAA